MIFTHPRKEPLLVKFDKKNVVKAKLMDYTKT